MTDIGQGVFQVSERCLFCEIVQETREASVVCVDDLTMAFMDARQFHPGHVLVIPRRHVRDLRELDEATGSAVMITLMRVTRAVDAVFPNEGLSLWHSIGSAAFQEVPHLHIHVHPRRTADGLLRIYPNRPDSPGRSTRETYAERIRAFL